MNILISGGAGYIGSTTASALADAGHHTVILDSLVSGQRLFTAGHTFYEGDIADSALVQEICQRHSIETAIHCAALIVVPESMAVPERYYRENCSKSLRFFMALREAGIQQVLVSSSASIYAYNKKLEVREESPFHANSPYARTKIVLEYMLEDLCRAWGMEGISLRYFNPIGADPQFRSGEHVANPSHVLGQLAASALGKIDHFELTGNDWPTRDGSGIRDYIHVWDLALAHHQAVERFATVMASGYTKDNFCAINLGTGRGTTVRELHSACERVRGKPIALVEAPRRPGDIPGAFANYHRAKELLNWSPTKSVEEGISDLFRWLERRQELLGY